MILQSLVNYYEELVRDGKISEPGWGPVKVSYALEINADGKILNVISEKIEDTKKAKVSMVPQKMILPAPVKRSSGVAANFLCDNSSYILGVDKNGKPKRTADCFQACKDLHIKILQDVDHPAARAVLKFFENWNPADIEKIEFFHDILDDVFSGANFIFSYQHKLVHLIPEIHDAWLQANQSNNKEKIFCLVTGKEDSLAILHPSIKGIAGAQSSGASLVSFNAPAFCSYGKEQGENAQTGEYAAFAYGAALNYLISDKEHTQYIGDTLVLCWAANGNVRYQDLMMGVGFGDDYYQEKDYVNIIRSLAKGEKVYWNEQMIDPEQEFYVLGISPNAARLSVRFFYRNSYGALMKNVLEHQQRLEIVYPSYIKQPKFSIWYLVQETVNQHSKDKKASSVLTGDLLRSVLENSPYPATLLNGVVLRIRADHDINYLRAAIIKAYYLKNEHKEVPKEVLTVSLNQESNNVAYNLGRLFAVLELVQEKANPNSHGPNTTIKDKYFNSASATPAHIFPTLIKLAQSHLKVVSRNDGKLGTYFEKLLSEIMGKIGEEFPNRLTLPEQGAFQLGYYHQRQEHFTKKEEK